MYSSERLNALKYTVKLYLYKLVIYPPTAGIIHIFSPLLHMHKTNRNLQKVPNLKLNLRLILFYVSLNINIRRQ